MLFLSPVLAATPYAAMVQDAQGYVHGCPQPVLVNALRLSAIDFFRKSEAYKYRPPSQDITVNVAAYSFALPADSEIHGYADVKFGGRSVEFMDWDDVTTRDPAFPSVVGSPGNFTYQELSTLYTVPVPDVTQTNGLLVSLVLRPTVSSSGVPTQLSERYHETIIHGAIRRVCMMDKMPWSDMKKAVLHGGLFNSGVNDAYSESQNDFGAKARHVQIRKFR